jgi:hypothetical protein
MQTVPQLGQHCGPHESVFIVRYYTRGTVYLAPNDPLLHTDLETLRATDSGDLGNLLATICRYIAEARDPKFSGNRRLRSRSVSSVCRIFIWNHLHQSAS